MLACLAVLFSHPHTRQDGHTLAPQRGRGPEVRGLLTVARIDCSSPATLAEMLSTRRVCLSVGLLLIAHCNAAGPVEVAFSGHYPARLGKDPRLEQALAAASYQHQTLDDGGGDVFDASDGVQRFRIQYDPQRSEWTLGALADDQLEPLLHAYAPSSQRHSPAAVETLWRVPGAGTENALSDVRCEYVSDAAELAAVELLRAAEAADAAAVLAAEEAALAAAEEEEQRAREEAEQQQRAREQAEEEQRAREAAARPSPRSSRGRSSSNDRHNAHTDAVVAGLIAFVALVLLLFVLAILWMSLPSDAPAVLPPGAATPAGAAGSGALGGAGAAGTAGVAGARTSTGALSGLVGSAPRRRVYASGVRLEELLQVIASADRLR